MSKQINRGRWLSVHLYYNEPWETFLKEAVEPYLRSAINAGVIQQYFFIRYWERGPHIRLRVKGQVDLIQSLLKPNLEEHFLSFLETKPSSRALPDYPTGFPDELKWLPNNSLQYQSYEAERERYGGAVGVQIAESQFHLSSDVVLQMLKQAPTWQYDDALGTAIQLQLSFVAAVGMERGEAALFFQFYFFNWLPQAFRHHEETLSQQAFLKQADEVLEAFKVSFEEQKDQLLAYHQSLWQALMEGGAFEDELMNKWRDGNAAVAARLDVAFKKNQLNLRAADYEFSDTLEIRLSPENKMRWMLYADYLHMTNNRLGVLNKDEGYVAFLIKECFKRIDS